MIKGLHHNAYRCRDSEETRKFYEDFLGLPLVHTLLIEQTKTGRTTGAGVLHTFFQLDDGSCLAFFEAPDMPFAFKDQHDFDLHIALEVDPDHLDRMFAKGKAEGREVRFLHYARNGDAHAFGSAVDDWARTYPQFHAFVVYEQGAVVEGEWPTALGRPTVAHLEDWLPADRDCDAYLLGPKPFMAFMRKNLAQLGLPESRIHYEFFGPAEALN